MSERCGPHGNLILDPSEPFPTGDSEYCHACWKAAGGAKRAGTTAAAVKAARRGRCLHLGPRVEFVPGCGGWKCRHECTAGESSAVPGGVCQTCPKWASES